MPSLSVPVSAPVFRRLALLRDLVGVVETVGALMSVVAPVLSVCVLPYLGASMSEVLLLSAFSLALFLFIGLAAKHLRGVLTNHIRGRRA